jgi:hypothetical protein
MLRIGTPSASLLILWALIAGIFVQPACRSSVCDGDAIDLPPLAHSDSVEVRALASCEATGGAWRPGLMACLCPVGHVFSSVSGCRPIREFVAKNPFGCARVGSVVVADADCPHADVDRDARLSQLLRGATVDSSYANPGDVMFKFGVLDARTIDKDLDYLERGPTNALSATYPADENVSGQRTQPIAACEELLGALEDASEGIPAHVCAMLERARGIVAGLDFPAPAVRMKEAGAGGNAIEFGITNLGRAFGSALYRIVGKRGIPAVRSLSIRLGDRLHVDALLSPQGEWIGGRIRQHLLAEAASNAAVRRLSLYYGPSYRPLGTDERHFGDRAGIARALRAAHGARTVIAPSDASRANVLRARGLLVERSLDPRLGNIFRRFRTSLSSLEVSKLPTVSVFDAPVLDDVDASLELVDLDADSHGLKVASVLAAGAPDAEFALFPLRTGGWLADIEKAIDSLGAAVRRERPQVVNISYGFEEDIADCREFFAPIFDEFHETTLFVLAAGNNGERNGVHVCPASLSADYGNVVSVGGVDEAGSIHSASNHGRKVVQIAAPFCTKVLGANHDFATPHERECGTSFSAPLVAGAALRGFAARPDLSAVDVKRLLLESCSGEGLDVECGGSLNTEAFDRNVRLFKAADRSNLRRNAGASTP